MLDADPLLNALPPLTAEDAAAYADGQRLRALAEARAPGWIDACLDAVLSASHPYPRGEARVALLAAPPEGLVPRLLDPLTSPNRRLRRRAMTLLPRLDAAVLVRELAAWLPRASREGRRAACVALAAVGDPALPLLHTLAADADASIARRALRALRVIEAREPPAAPLPESAQRPFGLSRPAALPPPRPRGFAVAAFNFSYGVNLGVLIRTAEAAGAEAVWVVGRDFYYRPSARGTDWHIPLHVLDSPRACLDRARVEGFQVVAVQQGPRAVSVFEAAWPERPLIVLGNEGDGLPAAFVAAADLQVDIPVAGRIDSLNVAVAAGVVCYAFLGRRAARPG